MSIIPEYLCSRCGELFQGPEIIDKNGWRPEEIMAEIAENNRRTCENRVHHICKDGMGFGEFIGLSLEGEWIENYPHQMEKRKRYEEKQRKK